MRPIDRHVFCEHSSGSGLCCVTVSVDDLLACPDSNGMHGLLALHIVHARGQSMEKAMFTAAEIVSIVALWSVQCVLCDYINLVWSSLMRACKILFTNHAYST